MNGENLQRAIYSKLIADTSLMALIQNVYADVEQPSDAGSNNPFPYVTIGNDSLVSWDSKTFVGTESICQVDIWSRQNNLTEAKTIGSAIVDALHYQTLTITGASHVITTQQSSAYSKDPDGHTKRGMLMFRVVFVRD
jgi:hypothetical protein